MKTEEQMYASAMRFVALVNARNERELRSGDWEPIRPKLLASLFENTGGVVPVNYPPEIPAKRPIAVHPDIERESLMWDMNGKTRN